MKEIKFRAWDKKRKMMVTVDELLNLWSQYSDDSPLKTIPFVTVVNQRIGKDLQLIVGKDCDLLQFTGLHDKEGKEIYEGDILDTCYGKGVVKLGIVRIDDNEGYADNLISGFYFEGPNENISKKHLGDIIDGVEPPEIIGNIWEDSHLLGDSHIWENKELLESD